MSTHAAINFHAYCLSIQLLIIKQKNQLKFLGAGKDFSDKKKESTTKATKNKTKKTAMLCFNICYNKYMHIYIIYVYLRGSERLHIVVIVL